MHSFLGYIDYFESGCRNIYNYSEKEKQYPIGIAIRSVVMAYGFMITKTPLIQCWFQNSFATAVKTCASSLWIGIAKQRILIFLFEKTKITLKKNIVRTTRTLLERHVGLRALFRTDLSLNRVSPQDTWLRTVLCGRESEICFLVR